MSALASYTLATRSVSRRVRARDLCRLSGIHSHCASLHHPPAATAAAAATSSSDMSANMDSPASLRSWRAFSSSAVQTTVGSSSEEPGAPDRAITVSKQDERAEESNRRRLSEVSRLLAVTYAHDSFPSIAPYRV